MQYFNALDLFITPLYFLLILFIAYYIRLKHRDTPLYKFFIPGLIAKIFGALAICFIYAFYYGGGDITNYHATTKAMVKLLLDTPDYFLKIWFQERTQENFYFTENTGYPIYWRDSNAFAVVNFSVPVELLGFTSFPASSIIMAALAYTGMWKLYLILCELYPSLYKQFSFSVLFIPSVLFWGSGIMKDTWTVSAACWYCHCFYKIFISKKNVVVNILPFLISIIIMVQIKPYIFVALMPGSILWGIWGTIKKIKNILIRIALGPIIITAGIALGVGLWMLVSSDLGVYSDMDKMVQKAYESQQDLKQEYYKGNTFDIGDFEPTAEGALSKFPQATVAGLFRPFIWEARNIVMFISGLENLFIMGFTLFFLIRVPLSFFKQIVSNPVVLFCILFSVMFAFAVGLSTSNFGALVRLKIPLWPFYMSALFIINFHRIKYKILKGDSLSNF